MLHTSVVALLVSIDFTTLLVKGMLPHMQAIMMGPLLMAGLTNGPRSIEADPSRISELLTDVSNEGLVSLAVPGDVPEHIRHSGAMLSAVSSIDAPLSLDATFRLLRVHDRSVQASSHINVIILLCFDEDLIQFKGRIW